MDKISVIIPTWNRSDQLPRAIRSALDQTLPVWEVLVCDDGSTDDSEQVVAALADKRVRWVPGLHAGKPAVPRNRGIDQSQGDWLAFLDSDDEWLPHKLETQMQVVKKNHLKAVCSNGYRRLPHAQAAPPLFFDPVKYHSLYSSSIIPFANLIHINYVICSSALLHKSLLTPIVRFPESDRLRAVEDYALWLRVASQVPFGFISEPLVYYQDDYKTSVRQADTAAIQQRKIMYVMEDMLEWHRSSSTLTDQQVRLVKERIQKLKKERITHFYRKARILLTSLFNPKR